MSIFSEISESKIFKDEEVLLPDYLPDILPHREQQIKQLANNLSPASKGRKPQNTFLFGPPGMGKTHVTKYVFREFEDFSERVKTIYLNCWDYKTAHAVISKIIIELGGFVQRRGMSKDEIIEKLIEVCRKNKKSLIICLDEVDQLIFNDPNSLYDLLRINQYIENPVGLVLISNNPNTLMNLEPRIKSSLSIDQLEFKSYSLEEMKDILNERIKYGYHSSPEPGVLILIANSAVKGGGDVRIGLELLLKAGRLAEQKNSDKVGVEDVRNVIRDVGLVKPKILKDRINETEKIIIDMIANGKLTSGELYKKYCESVEEPISERMFRNFINHLSEIGLIKVRDKKHAKGQTRIISRPSY